MTINAFERAVKKLVSREHSTAQIVRFLREKGYSENEISSTIARLKDYNYIDDVRFAYKLVESYTSRCGKNQIEYKLREAGVSSDIISEALSGHNDNESALKTAGKYLRSRGEVPKQKLLSYLHSKGYSMDAINYAVTNICND